MSDCVTFYIFLFSLYRKISEGGAESVLFAGLSDFTSTRHAGRREMHCFLIEVRCRRELLRRNVGWKRGGGASAAGHRHGHKFAIQVLMGNYCPDTDTDIQPEYAPLRSSRPSFFFLSSATPLIICYRYGKFESCRRTYITCAYAQTFCFVLLRRLCAICAYVLRAESVVVMVVGVRYVLYKVKVIFPKKGTHGRECLIDVSAPGTASHSLTDRAGASICIRLG